MHPKEDWKAEVRGGESSVWREHLKVGEGKNEMHGKSRLWQRSDRGPWPGKPFAGLLKSTCRPPMPDARV